MDKPPIKFTDEDRALLSKHKDFYTSLSTGWREPTTKAQAHFVEVCKKRVKAETPHEIAWLRQLSWNLWKQKEIESVEEAKRKVSLKGKRDGKAYVKAKRKARFKTSIFG